jgi:hypothetical protein
MRANKRFHSQRDCVAWHVSAWQLNEVEVSKGNPERISEQFGELLWPESELVRIAPAKVLLTSVNLELATQF